MDNFCTHLTSSVAIQCDAILDARSFFCPEPLMLIRGSLRTIKNGEILKVLCDDPTSFRDVQNFCHFVGHRLLHINKADKELCFFIQKSNMSSC